MRNRHIDLGYSGGKQKIGSEIENIFRGSAKRRVKVYKEKKKSKDVVLNRS